MQGNIPENQLLATLYLESGTHPPDSPQQTIVEFLSTNREHFSPSRVQDDAAEQVSSRVEGFFGAYKNMAHHEIISLPTAVKGICILGQMDLTRLSRATAPTPPPEITSIPDQKQIGSFAAIIILQEHEKLEHTHVVPGPEVSPNCCKVVRVHHLPCVYCLISRTDRLPRLTILDVHVRWQCRNRRKDVTVSDLRVDLDTHQEPRKSSRSQWNFAELVARFEPHSSAAERRSEYQAILNDTCNNSTTSDRPQ
jgi:hypothetical protein